jgi:N-acetylglucosamine malate deacetylase 2
MTSRYRLVAVFAHPDDETYRPGGTLALLARQGVSVQVLAATLGQAGSCGNPAICTQQELPSVRRRELICACAALGIQPPIILDYEDGKLVKVDSEKLLANVMDVVKAFQPQVMLSFGPDGLSGHPDHIAIGHIAQSVYNRAGQVSALYTVAVPQSLAQKLAMLQVKAVPDAEISLDVDIASAWAKKLAAIRCHATQLSSTPLMSAPEAQQRLFFGREYFVKAAERDPLNNFMPEILKEVEDVDRRLRSGSLHPAL